MYKHFVLLYLALMLITIPPIESRGRSISRSKSRSSSTVSHRDFSESHADSGGSHKIFERSHTHFGGSSSESSSSHFGSSVSQHTNGGWFNGFFRSPFHNSYVPSRTSSIGTNSYQESREKEKINSKDADNYAVGYGISRALNNDFFSIFNLVHDISKIANKIKNKETYTTESPVATYNTKHFINNPYKEKDLKPYKIDEISIFDFNPDNNTVQSSSDIKYELRNGESNESSTTLLKD